MRCGRKGFQYASRRRTQTQGGFRQHKGNSDAIGIALVLPKIRYGSEESCMIEKKNKVIFSLGSIILTVMAGAIVTFSMYSLIQNSFFKTTVAHEMELMQIMETLGSQLIDLRLENLKSEMQDAAEQYGGRLASASEEEIEQLLSTLRSESGDRDYCYQTGEKQYYSSQLQESDMLQIDLSQVWEGDTVIFFPDLNGNFLAKPKNL